MKKTWVRLYTRFSRNLWNREFRIFKFDRMFATGPPIATPKAWKRASSRYLTCVAVRSRDLPQQRALTVDLSETGVCLETFSKVSWALRRRRPLALPTQCLDVLRQLLALLRPLALGLSR